MKALYRTAVRNLLCTGLLLGSGAFALAQEPTTQPTAPDNTKVNERDRNQNEPAADQQKDNRSDRDITQQIRQSIMKDKSLSTYAHNIKIVTQGGQVTLKGPVRSEDEKRAIEAKATEVAGGQQVCRGDSRAFRFSRSLPECRHPGFKRAHAGTSGMAAGSVRSYC